MERGYGCGIRLWVGSEREWVSVCEMKSSRLDYGRYVGFVMSMEHRIGSVMIPLLYFTYFVVEEEAAECCAEFTELVSPPEQT